MIVRSWRCASRAAHLKPLLCAGLIALLMPLASLRADEAAAKAAPEEKVAPPAEQPSGDWKAQASRRGDWGSHAWPMPPWLRYGHRDDEEESDRPHVAGPRHGRPPMERSLDGKDREGRATPPRGPWAGPPAHAAWDHRRSVGDQRPGFWPPQGAHARPPMPPWSGHGGWGPPAGPPGGPWAGPPAWGAHWGHSGFQWHGYSMTFHWTGRGGFGPPADRDERHGPDRHWGGPPRHHGQFEFRDHQREGAPGPGPRGPEAERGDGPGRDHQWGGPPRHHGDGDGREVRTFRHHKRDGATDGAHRHRGPQAGPEGPPPHDDTEPAPDGPDAENAPETEQPPAAPPAEREDV